MCGTEPSTFSRPSLSDKVVSAPFSVVKLKSQEGQGLGGGQFCVIKGTLPLFFLMGLSINFQLGVIAIVFYTISQFRWAESMRLLRSELTSGCYGSSLKSSCF